MAFGAPPRCNRRPRISLHIGEPQRILDGTRLTLGSVDNTIRLWIMNVGFWIGKACFRAERNLT